MSQVYTRSEVLTGRTPVRESFKVVLEALQGGLVELHEMMPTCIPVAGVFGSVARNFHTVCSDIDCIVGVDDGKKDKLHIYRKVQSSKALSEAMRLAESLFVQLSIYPVAISDLKTDNTRNDKQFLMHIHQAVASGGVLCGEARAFKRFYQLAPDNSASRSLAYIYRKVEKLEQRLFCLSGLTEQEEARMYLDTYQAPFHALRRYLDLIHRAPREDSKDGLVRAFREISDEEYVFNLANLRNRWGEYVKYIQYAHEHKGAIPSPFMIEDVHDAISILRYIGDCIEDVERSSSVRSS